MSLRVGYTAVDDCIYLSTSQGVGGSWSLVSDSGTVIDTHPDSKYRPTALEVLYISSYLPLETNGGYCPDTDTLVIGEGKDTATLVEENGDLSAYWAPDEDFQGSFDLVAAGLRNASKHLAPAIANHLNQPADEKEKQASGKPRAVR